MGRRVLVLRPEPGAGATAARLMEMGFSPVLLPLTRIVPVDVDLPVGIDRVSAIAATSANAIRHADAVVIGRLKGMPLHAVGAATAEAARGIGLDVAHVGRGDGAELARHLVRSLPAGASVCYLCGRVRRADFELALATGGIAVLPVPTYDTLPIDYSDDELSARLGEETFWAVLIHSPNAGMGFASLAARSRAARLFEGARIAAISEQAAGAVSRGGGLFAEVARAPSEAALLELLSGWT